MRRYKRFNQMLAFLLFALFFVLLVGMTQEAFAQSVVNQEAVDLTWSLEGLDPDVQAFRLYVNTQPDFATAVQLGEDLPYNPNDPTAAEAFEWPTMNIDIPADQNSTRYFWVTAVDTSGNECFPGSTHPVCLANPPEMATVEFDRTPPTPPTGLTVTARVVVNTVQ